jgi:hypothetical protein
LTALYATAVRDEVWLHGVRIENRLAHGIARSDGETIHATDRPDAELVARVTERMPSMRALLPALGDARVRLVAEATSEDDEERESGTITVTLGGVSIVTDEAHALGDVEALRRLLRLPPATRHPPPASTPFVWRNGSASVLLHEAVGHAAELGVPTAELPPWLLVDVPLRLRRATFRDVPLLRMTTLVATQVDAPFELPQDAIDVHLIAGGGYEPLTGMVTVEIALATYRGGRIPPFSIVKSRDEVLASLAGATGEPLRYPGVICSREGQELVVGSCAPVMVTR